MLFKNPPRLASRLAISKYLEADLWSWCKDIVTGLTKISFADNFDSFRIDNLAIVSGQEVAVANQLKNRYQGVIPTSRIIVRQTGNSLVVDGPTPWTVDELFLQNVGANDVVVSVIFFR